MGADVTGYLATQAAITGGQKTVFPAGGIAMGPGVQGTAIQPQFYSQAGTTGQQVATPRHAASYGTGIGSPVPPFGVTIINPLASDGMLL